MKISEITHLTIHLTHFGLFIDILSAYVIYLRASLMKYVPYLTWGKILVVLLIYYKESLSYLHYLCWSLWIVLNFI